MNEKLEQTWQQLKTQRDEIRLQIHLAKSELKDEWEKLDPTWQKAQHEYDELKEATEDAAHDMHKSLTVVTDELSSAFERIKKRLD
jgi:hypothetical protein